jgi:short-subunit dehydrogenase
MKTILITGASSGLGAALAEHYASAGARLILTGRNEERLARVAAHCKEKGASVETQAIDVNNKAAMEQFITAADARTPIDLAIANAGISAGTGIHGETSDQAEAIFTTNINGVTNTIHPLIPRMQARGRGQIGVVSSVAGMLPVASAPAYSASKAWARAYALALRGNLRGYGVQVSAICPGYVATPMTDANRFPMPFMLPADKAAAIIAQGLAKNKGQIAFPLPMVALVTLAAHLPEWLISMGFNLLPKKGEI